MTDSNLLLQCMVSLLTSFNCTLQGCALADLAGGLCHLTFALRLLEMPISGDLKSGDCLFFTPAPRKIDSAPNGNDLGHYMTSYMMYILSKFKC